MSAYYNEREPYAAQWLRNLIAAGLIAPGDVDERDIQDVTPGDLRGFVQHHFFAGIGVWSHALRLAGWPDSRPVWTGSCPCQPFSAAGQGAGFADERHLWPAFFHLIEECRPSIVFGEQVASKDAEPWIDLVQTDLEALGYAVGAVPFPAAGVGAPHIRDRLYWLADSNGGACRQGSKDVRGWVAGGNAQPWTGSSSSSMPGRLAHPAGAGRGPGRENFNTSNCVEAIRTGQTQSRRCGTVSEPCPTNGHWRDADWLFCRDGKWRPVEPGTFPLAHGATNRVGRLRAYGNAIVAEAAKAFIESYMECQP